MRTIANFICLVGALVVTSAQAQTSEWSAEQAAIWTVVEDSWAAQAAENGKWPAAFSHEKFISWEDSRAAPEVLEVYAARQRENDKAGDLTSHDVSPMTIKIMGDTAVVAYSAKLEFASSDGETGSASRNILEVLVRDGGSWRYLASVDFTPNDD